MWADSFGGMMGVLTWEPKGKPVYAALGFWILLAMSVLITRYTSQDMTEATWYSLTERTLLRLPIALWVFFDAEDRLFEKSRRDIYASMSLIVPEISIPIFLVKSRGWREAGKSVLRFLGCFLLLAAAVWPLQLLLDQFFHVSQP